MRFEKWQALGNDYLIVEREAILYLRRHGWTDADQFTIRTVAGPITPTITSERTCSVEIGGISRFIAATPGFGMS